MAVKNDTPGFFRWQADTGNRRLARAVNDPGLHVTLINKDDGSVFWESQPPAGMLQVEGGSKWPDVLENTSLTGLYVAERVIDALDARWPQSFEVEQVTGVRSKCRANPDEAPRYYRLTPKGSVAFDLDASNLSHLKLDPETGKVLEGRLHGSRDIILPDSWDGQPLCLCRRPLLPKFVYCTRDIIELARAERWSNARFVPTGLTPKESTHWQIDYLGRHWPPRWYPKRPSAADEPEALRHTLRLLVHLMTHDHQGSIYACRFIACCSGVENKLSR